MHGKLNWSNVFYLFFFTLFSFSSVYFPTSVWLTGCIIISEVILLPGIDPCCHPPSLNCWWGEGTSCAQPHSHTSPPVASLTVRTAKHPQQPFPGLVFTYDPLLRAVTGTTKMVKTAVSAAVVTMCRGYWERAWRRNRDYMCFLEESGLTAKISSFFCCP